MRQTYQRQVILEELRKVTSHPPAGELFEMVKKRIPNISFGTVYRNLKLLKDKGYILELALGKEASRWDGNANPHYHFTCTNCSRVYDLSLEPHLDWVKEVEVSMGFVVSDHRVEFYGLCQGCRPSSRGKGAPK